MPTYEYECPRCGTVEVFQSMKDDALTTCPNCGSKEFQRQISGGAGVIFKGSGFYETDYNRSKSYNDSAKADSKGDAARSESKPADTKKTDAKPAKKAKE